MSPGAVSAPAPATAPAAEPACFSTSAYCYAHGSLAVPARRPRLLLHPLPPRTLAFFSLLHSSSFVRRARRLPSLFLGQAALPPASPTKPSQAHIPPLSFELSPSNFLHACSSFFRSSSLARQALLLRPQFGCSVVFFFFRFFRQPVLSVLLCAAGLTQEARDDATPCGPGRQSGQAARCEPLQRLHGAGAHCRPPHLLQQWRAGP